MNSRLKLVAVNSEHQEVIVHPRTLEELGLLPDTRIILQFGIRSVESVIISSCDTKWDEIGIARVAVELLGIPLVNSYEVRVDGNTLRFGPYIGILTKRKVGSLKKYLETLSSYVHHYEQIGGTILAFYPDEVNQESHLIHGLLYNSQTKEWDKGTYPLPAAIFKTLITSSELSQYFKSTIGNTVFNSPIFNKWEMYDWLYSYHDSFQYFPKTSLYRHPRDLELYSDDYKSVYLKPIDGFFGKGIIKVSKSECGLRMEERKGRGRKKEHEFISYTELDHYLSRRLQEKTYILQQGLELISCNGRMVDFRLIIVKNQQGEWESIGMVARYGKARSVVSNILSGGIAETGEVALKKILLLSDDEVVNLKNKMVGIAIQAAKGIEKRGVQLGNLGIDLAIDQNNRIWIIEMNNKNPDHTIALNANDHDMYYRALRNNLLYA
ncbi:YheC/YheD family protein [Ammoniphilus sp. CFH 90114]|uniref:YheC/YheD family endospore coat-associated protein n=1 Tax=Ammoniphilus sp. CFH 90114 TaxID=2493665 RepID=UPI00100FD39F|nr:YheC/YheD family protein [Ammoniphilus sp. CFH 90114]RXT14003.1 hypothetical protein EIZ39_07665 [Ammoniphilus sp. CFH 90114]